MKAAMNTLARPGMPRVFICSSRSLSIATVARESYGNLVDEQNVSWETVLR